ncbi:chromodomain-helicase-DNA-binding protein 1-like [Podarcis raffonei]|uniref:chromodomain-helicase-DNA-binding protein 1-like n=1 Tax=Podarcis raffonei TaxID=65483 RepID=UPI00232986F0|nr:chromodomain-helicase-DNA-binding protein 1-like [Podarcis raffonei]
MSRFFQSVSAKRTESQGGPSVEEQHLRQWGLAGIHLRPYQMEGVNWLTHCYETWHGCILGDEMGLGKTCQAISLLVVLSGKLNKRPFLILCPLSVLNNWKQELERFSPSLSLVTYSGNKEERTELQQDFKSNHDFHILLTTYEVCLRDTAFLKRFSWACLVVDEAHRLKNQDSLLHKVLFEFTTDFNLLLTGTPIQNSLQELYALLAFIEPATFPKELVEEFVRYYHGIEKESKVAKELHSLLQPFLLRRVKADVAAELPKKEEVVLYHGMSALQRKFYKAVLMKDLDAFENESGKKAKLQNVLVQLRKCVAHPYLFNGKKAVQDHSCWCCCRGSWFAVLVTGIQPGPSKKRRKLSPEELAARQRKRQEAAAERARLREEKKQKKAEAEHQKNADSSEEETERDLESGMGADLEYADPDLSSIKYVIGDVTHPSAGEEDAIIVHCVDDSGRWGRGGLFTALGKRSDHPRKIYELAGKMKDLTLGGTLLFPIDDKESRNKGHDLLALIVAQHRDRSNNLSGINLPALERGLKKIYLAAKDRDASVHLPRIGYSTKGFNWYGTERLIRKYLTTKGIPTFVYYFPRKKASSSQASTSASSLQP